MFLKLLLENFKISKLTRIKMVISSIATKGSSWKLQGRFSDLVDLTTSPTTIINLAWGGGSNPAGNF